MKSLAMLFIIALAGCGNQSSSKTTACQTNLLPAIVGNWQDNSGAIYSFDASCGMRVNSVSSSYQPTSSSSLLVQNPRNGDWAEWSVSFGNNNLTYSVAGYLTTLQKIN